MHHVFRQIQRKDTVLGLEVVDCFLLLMVLGLLLMFCNGIGASLTLAAITYVALFVLKAGKPNRHTFYLFQFYASQRRRAAGVECVEESKNGVVGGFFKS